MALPSFHLTEIPDDGLSVTCEVRSDELGLTSEEAHVIGELSVSLNVFMAGRRIEVSGTLTGTFRRQCVRCLKEYEDTLNIPITAEYECDPSVKRHGKPVGHDPRKTHGQEAEAEEVADEEVYPCAGDRLDLSEMLREHIILSVPMQPLCGESCLGLCPTCGQDRNETACGCAEPSRTNPFAVLRELQKKANG
ncbi:MAG TPA: DUF177 domain-containing protein [Nitrospiraceae bacterium]|nr:DUF177 domain-containing protein [Nitrospiraceae bacterium]